MSTKGLDSLKGWLAAAEARLFPPHCLVCTAAGTPGRDLCAGCLNTLPRPGNVCRRCAEPLAAPVAEACGRCQRQPPPYDRTLTALRYEEPVDQLIQSFKFHGRLTAGRLLGELLADAVVADELPQALIPVPLHPARLRERGFNQALELARPLARRFGLPLLTNNVVRVRDTRPQSQLGYRLRVRNVRSVFALSRPLAYRHVALIDDVMTTGSTLAELARVVRAGGAQTVWVWVVARAGGVERRSADHRVAADRKGAG